VTDNWILYQLTWREIQCTFCYKIEEYYLVIIFVISFSFASSKIFNFKVIYYTKNNSNILQIIKRYFYWYEGNLLSALLDLISFIWISHLRTFEMRFRNENKSFEYDENTFMGFGFYQMIIDLIIFNHLFLN